MKKCWLILMALLPALLNAEETTDGMPVVDVRTNLGTFTLILDRKRAPVTVDNFLQYVSDGFYDGTIFHRVIDGFMAQGGGYDVDYDKKDTRPPVINESNNGLSNLRGTIAMARLDNPDSATAQFFINLTDNTNLDSPPRPAGYTVFGKVSEGMNVIDNMAEISTGPGGPFRRDVPASMIIIEHVTVRSAP